MNESKLPGKETLAFRKMLRANVALPIFLVLGLCALYLSLTLYLLKLNSHISRSDRVIARTTSLLEQASEGEAGMRGFLLTRQESFLDPFRHSISTFPTAAEALLIRLEGNREQLDQLARAVAHFERWQEIAEARLLLARDGKSVSLQQSQQSKAIMDSVRANLREILEEEIRIRDDRSEEAAATSKAVMVFTLIAGFIVAGLIAYFGRRQLVTLASSFDSAMKQQLEQNSILEHQSWLRTGQSELLASLRGELAEEEVAQRIISFFADYLGADLGTLYARQPREKTLHRLAALGPNAEILDTKPAIAWGEGLVGKVADTQKAEILNDLPEDYLRVSSSLGSTKVKTLILAPLLSNGEVTAVLELGFLRPVEPRSRELFELLADSLGTIVQASALRTRQNALFEETQQLNEELQSQQEELRVSNEELEQQTSMLKESQVRMESQQVELEESNQKLETQTTLLRERSRELAEASQYKSEFLANMSHELRTPLNSSLILAKLLADNPQGNLSSEQVEFAETIYSAGNDLLVLINDILDLAKVEAGRLELHPEKISLQALSDSMRKTFQPLANKKGLELQIEVKESRTIETDRLRLEQILKNLLSNAIKFTETGKVKLEVFPQGESVGFAVTDTGIGIPESQQENIFEAFRQADGTTNRRYGGTGLGLSISRELAHLLGGPITVESSPGRGSRFQLVLPLVMPVSQKQSRTRISEIEDPLSAELPSEKRPRKPGSRSSHPLPERAADDRDSLDPGRHTVLVIEDDASFAKALKELAGELGFQVIVAHTAAEGLNLAREFRPSAVLLDIALPDQTGMAVLNNLKDDLKTRHIPVHVVSGHDYSQAALEMGAIGYMLKPVRKEELTRAFHLLEEKFSQTLKRVLIVEDDPVQRKSIASLIAADGVESVHAPTGSEALDMLGKLKFDCVILDLTLPDMTGFVLLEKMAAMGPGNFPPVVVYTGRDLTRSEEDRLRRYSNSIIIKGARSPERLLDEVTLFLHQVESELPADKRRMIQSVKNRDKVLEGKTILLVDDDARNLFALMHVLEPRGAKVEVARNGKEALAAIKKLDQIDLVLMDIMMPEMDGYEAIREIRRNPNTANLPVIAVTAKAMAKDYEKCLKAGANDYLSKPIDIHRLISLLQIWIQRGQR